MAINSQSVFRLIIKLSLGLLLLFFASSVHSDTEKKQIRWDLADLYPTQQDWAAEREQLLLDINQLSLFKGQLSNTPQTLLQAMDLVSALQKTTARMFIYASLTADEDIRVLKAQENLSLANSAIARLKQATAFISPEILSIGKETIERFIQSENGLQKHAFNLRNTLRRADHTLNEQAEHVLANATNLLNGPQNTYNALKSAVPWPEVILSFQEKATLNPAGYNKYRAVYDREDRKKVFEAHWDAWKAYEAPFGQTLSMLVKSHIFAAKSRHFETSLESTSYNNNIPTTVYAALIQSANDNLLSLHRYLKLRRRMLKLDQLYYYDIYPNATKLERTFSLDEAKELTLASLEPFGKEYLTFLEDGFSGNWMHAYPQVGKRSGAYMQGAGYDVHPYILLNYNKGFEDVSTFSHEWGHAVHTLLARKHNPYETYAYSPFTAELASTTNEILLQEYMLAKDLSHTERLYYIDRALETYHRTFFRQAMFAEFELRIHEHVEAGQTLSGAKMTELYLTLLKKYYGHAKGVMNIDPAYAIEWASIPHLYYNFYVYQYATSIAGGTLFAESILNGDIKAREKYLNVLKAGGSKYPYQMLREASVDLATPLPYEALIARMNRLTNEANDILERTK